MTYQAAGKNDVIIYELSRPIIDRGRAYHTNPPGVSPPPPHQQWVPVKILPREKSSGDEIDFVGLIQIIKIQLLSFKVRYLTYYYVRLCRLPTFCSVWACDASPIATCAVGSGGKTSAERLDQCCLNSGTRSGGEYYSNSGMGKQIK